MPVANAEDDVNHKDHPWAFWKKSRVWKDNLERKASYKALDIPDDEMGVSTTKKIDKSRHGLGAIGAIGVALAAGLPPSVLALLMLLKQDKPTVPPAVDKPPVEKPKSDPGTDIDVDARFEYDPPKEQP